MPSLKTFSAADFEPRRGEPFRIAAADGAIELRLVEVRKLATGARAGGGFALDFVMSEGPHLPQATYPLANDAIGSLEIFLVPIGPVEGGLGYEAIFM